MATEKRVPDGDSSVALSRSAGATNASCVDEDDTSLDTADYVYLVAPVSGEGAAEDLYTLADFTGVVEGDQISSLKVWTYAGKSTNNIAATLRPIIVENGVTTRGSFYALPIAASASWQSQEWLFRPSDGGNWTFTDLQAMVVGLGMTATRTGGTGEARCYGEFVEVTYTSGASGWVMVIVPQG